MTDEMSPTEPSSPMTNESVEGRVSPLLDVGQREVVEGLWARRERVRVLMGGERGLARVRADGKLTVRERIDLLVDPGSFQEVGTFVVSERPEDRETTAGDGKIGGHARVAGRAVTVVGDDQTVKRGSTAFMGGRRKKRLFAQALRSGQPFVHLGESAGARIPDVLGARGATELESDVASARRRRQIPLVSVITGASYGGSSFVAAHSDFVVQVRGATLSVTSPRLVESATGERVSAEDLGGVEVHARRTGQIDVVADDDVEAMELVRQFLSYLPQNGWSVPARLDVASVVPADEMLADVVPSRLQRGYDVRSVVRRLADGGEFLELQPLFGRGLFAGLMRLGGFSVGVLASQPKYGAGALDPNACDKASRLLCLCEAFNIPLIFLQDVPGFMVGKQVEHDRMLAKAIMFQQALALSSTPKITVIMRKAFGLAYLALAGSPELSDAVYAWPGARFGLMDKKSGAQVVRNNDFEGLSAEERRQRQQEAGEEFETAFDGYTPAERMRIDEVIDPADTRNVLVADLERLTAGRLDPARVKPLASWPTHW